MSQDVTWPQAGPVGEFVVPGTCFCHTPAVAEPCVVEADETGRDRVLRYLYLKTALADVPRLLGSIDRNPYRPTYGCLDRQFWHYRTSPFPSEMYQEGALPLALVYATKLPGNRWQGNGRVRELAIAAIRFAARSDHVAAPFVADRTVRRAEVTGDGGSADGVRLAPDSRHQALAGQIVRCRLKAQGVQPGGQQARELRQRIQHDDDKVHTAFPLSVRRRV